MPLRRWSQLLSAVSIAITVASACCNQAHAAPNGAVYLDSYNVVDMPVNGKTYTCGNIPPWTIGARVDGYFLPTTNQLADLKAKIRRAKKLAQKLRLQRSQKLLKSYQSSGQAICSSVGGEDTSRYFNADATVNGAGKVAFAIPSSLTASVLAGISAWKSTCFGCHGTFPSALPTRDFVGIRAAVQGDPMYLRIPAEVTDQQLADITAYANY